MLQAAVNGPRPPTAAGPSPPTAAGPSPSPLIQRAPPVGPSPLIQRAPPVGPSPSPPVVTSAVGVSPLIQRAPTTSAAAVPSVQRVRLSTPRVVGLPSHAVLGVGVREFTPANAHGFVERVMRSFASQSFVTKATIDERVCAAPEMREYVGRDSVQRWITIKTILQDERYGRGKYWEHNGNRSSGGGYNIL